MKSATNLHSKNEMKAVSLLIFFITEIKQSHSRTLYCPNVNVPLPYPTDHTEEVMQTV